MLTNSSLLGSDELFSVRSTLANSEDTVSGLEVTLFTDEWGNQKTVTMVVMTQSHNSETQFINLNIDMILKLNWNHNLSRGLQCNDFSRLESSIFFTDFSKKTLSGLSTNIIYYTKIG